MLKSVKQYSAELHFFKNVFNFIFNLYCFFRITIGRDCNLYIIFFIDTTKSYIHMGMEHIVFVDAGDVADVAGHLRPRVGVGSGVRVKKIGRAHV